MKTGLFFGSFNPVHNGHLMIANYMLEFTDLDLIRFIVSPQNPFKKKKNLLEDYHRLEMLIKAVDNMQHYQVSDIEFRMPKPSFTIDTLIYLQERYPNEKFALIMGSDNLKNLHKWKNSALLLKDFEIKVYSRPNEYTEKYVNHPNISFYNAPLMEISSSFIRKAIKQNKKVNFYMPNKAYKYMREMHFYE
ncbi:MAG: nicotinate (nicotinamide) nucleotide adenylyltransferase [Bacteroidota bacterium]|nr:nicotinate (nicotinamide) nucleotide adenylyltransferase [Bacteroidota bacterium]